MGCTMEEIASVIGVSKDTIERRCREDINLGKQQGKVSLRRKQFELAYKGDRVMLIWLGKQYLGQADKQEHTGRDGGPIQNQDVPATEAERAERVTALLRRAEMRRRGAG